MIGSRYTVCVCDWDSVSVCVSESVQGTSEGLKDWLASSAEYKDRDKVFVLLPNNTVKEVNSGLTALRSHLGFLSMEELRCE